MEISGEITRYECKRHMSDRVPRAGRQALRLAADLAPLGDRHDAAVVTVGYALVLCLLRRRCSWAREPTLRIRFVEALRVSGRAGSAPAHAHCHASAPWGLRIT